jgi:deoxycytidylate deaminase
MQLSESWHSCHLPGQIVHQPTNGHRDLVLFSTTFPCHMCARHIVSAGIKRVVFLEPYPKSYAEELYADSITFDRLEARIKGHVPGDGVARRHHSRERLHEWSSTIRC